MCTASLPSPGDFMRNRYQTDTKAVCTRRTRRRSSVLLQLLQVRTRITSVSSSTLATQSMFDDFENSDWETLNRSEK